MRMLFALAAAIALAPPAAAAAKKPYGTITLLQPPAGYEKRTIQGHEFGCAVWPYRGGFVEQCELLKTPKPAAKPSATAA